MPNRRSDNEVERRIRRARTIASALALLLAASSAAADEAATADAVFREGRKAMQRGAWSDAAALFKESQRLAPAPGTLLNLAVSEEKLGLLADAWEHARSAGEQLSPEDDRRKIAQRLFDDLDRRVPRITIRALDLPPGARVAMDGMELRPASLGVPLPINPGEHRLVVKVSGRVDRVILSRVDEGAAREEIVEAGRAIVEGEPAHDVTAGGDSASPALRTAGWIGVAVGAAAVVTGSVFGGLTLDRNAVVNAHCNGPACDPQGFDAARDGRTFSVVSTTSFIAGGVLIGAGVLIVLLTAR